jgi:hypothetical protein
MSVLCVVNPVTADADSKGKQVLLIGLMSLKNQLVYIQFHPVTYMVKLNIEMTMAHLITKIAVQPGVQQSMPRQLSSSGHYSKKLDDLERQTSRDTDPDLYKENTIRVTVQKTTTVTDGGKQLPLERIEEGETLPRSVYSWPGSGVRPRGEDTIPLKTLHTNKFSYLDVKK